MKPDFGMATLYVGDLHPEVTEPMLAERFSPAGRIHSIRLCRDWKTGSSLGYAYINFQQRADAERALEMFHFELLMGQPMRVLWSQRDSTLRKSGIGNLFIKNLDKSIDSVALYDTFSIFGKVLSCKVVGYEIGSKGYGYIQFESVEAARLAMDTLNGKLLNNRKVSIEHFKAHEERKAEAASRSPRFTSIYIKNLGDDVDNKMLNDIFSKFGTPLSVCVVTDKKGKSKGFGFVRFERHEDAKRALMTMNGQELNGKKMYVGKALTKEERHAQFRQNFEQVKIENNCSRGCGFTPISPSEEATKARNTISEAQNLAAYHAPSQKVETRPDLLWIAQNIQPQSVQYMPDVVYSASVHQQTGGTIPTSPSQVPCMMEESPHKTTTTTVETVELEDTVPAMDSVPAEDPLQSPESVPAEEAHPSLESVPAIDTLAPPESVPSEEMSPAVESVPARDRDPAVDSIPDPDQGVDEVSALTQAPEEVPPASMASDVPAYPPAGKRLTIYMLESAPVDEQIQMAHDYMLPLVEKIHPIQAKKITWMLLEGENNSKIMNMIGDPEILRARVDEMDALLRAGEAGYKPETLKTLFYNGNNKKNKKKNKRNKK